MFQHNSKREKFITESCTKYWLAFHTYTIQQSQMVKQWELNASDTRKYDHLVYNHNILRLQAKWFLRGMKEAKDVNMQAYKSNRGNSWNVRNTVNYKEHKNITTFTLHTCLCSNLLLYNHMFLHYCYQISLTAYYHYFLT